MGLSRVLLTSIALCVICVSFVTPQPATVAPVSPPAKPPATAPVSPPAETPVTPGYCRTEPSLNETAAGVLLNATLVAISPGCDVASYFIAAGYAYPYSSCVETVTCQNRSTPHNQVIALCCDNATVDASVDDWGTNIFSNPFWWICNRYCPRIWMNDAFEGRNVTLFVEVDQVDYQTVFFSDTQGKEAFGGPVTFAPVNVNTTSMYGSTWIFVETDWALPGELPPGNSSSRRPTLWVQFNYGGDNATCADGACLIPMIIGFSNENTTAGYGYVFNAENGVTAHPTASIVFGDWNHFMLTLSNGTMDCYINGVKIYTVLNVTTETNPNYYPDSIYSVLIQTRLFNYTYQVHYSEVSVGYAITSTTPGSPGGLASIPSADVTILPNRTLTGVTAIGGFLLNYGGILNVPTNRATSGNMTITQGYRGAGTTPLITFKARTGSVLKINGPTEATTPTQLRVSIATGVVSETIVLIDLSGGSGTSKTGDFILEGGGVTMTVTGIVYNLTYNGTTNQWVLVSGPNLSPGQIAGIVIGSVVGAAILVAAIVWFVTYGGNSAPEYVRNR